MGTLNGCLFNGQERYYHTLLSFCYIIFLAINIIEELNEGEEEVDEAVIVVGSLLILVDQVMMESITAYLLIGSSKLLASSRLAVFLCC